MGEKDGWATVKAPTLDDLRALAGSALARLPEIFTRKAGALAILVEDFADEETLAAMGFESPFDLLGLYQGVDLTRASGGDILHGPNLVHLYRRPILDLWAEGEETLEALVTHVLIHEIGHHFGLSDAAIDAIERAAGDGA